MNDQMLVGKRIILTRAREQAEELAEKLRALGAEPQICPTIAFAPPADTSPLDAALANLAHFDWLLMTSANAVRFLSERMTALGIELAALHAIQIGAVGPATAQALASHGFTPAFVATVARAEGLLEAIGDLRGARVLLPCTDIARSELAEGLQAKGAIVSVVTAYRTVPGPGIGEITRHLREHVLDAVVFASPSAAHYLLEGMGADRALLHQIALVCIGPTTAAAVRAAGLPIATVAVEPTSDGVVEALIQAFQAD